MHEEPLIKNLNKVLTTQKLQKADLGAHAFKKRSMSAIYNVNEDFLQDTKMISEDYISKEAIGSSAWKGPLSKKHNKAILATFVIALTLSIATNKNFYSTSEESDSSSNSNMFAYSDEHVTDIDDSVPLTQAYGITSNKDKTHQMENYDDSLPDADLADSPKARLVGDHAPALGLIPKGAALQAHHREALIQCILDAQLTDGGWAFSGENADSDMTGMALTALAPYYVPETETAHDEKSQLQLALNLNDQHYSPQFSVEEKEAKLD